MSAEPHERFTLDEYLALERAAERRFEFRSGDVVCMSGGTIQHATITDNVQSALAARLGGKKCRAFSSGIAVHVPDGAPYRYPDVTVVCGDLRYRTIDVRHVLENPILLAEVLSKSSADFDRGTKFEEYRSIPTFREYLLIDQMRPHVAHRSMLDDGGWVERLIDSLDLLVPLPSPGIELPMAEIYADVTFATAGRTTSAPDRVSDQ